jgi:hypothetical protein
VFTFSNDSGATWQDNTLINDLSDLGEIATRTAFVYDSTNDCLHGLLYYNTDVVVYRKYTLQYSGSSITGIAWTRGVDANTVLHSVGSVDFEHPIIFKVGTYVVCLWSTTGSTGANITAVRCDIGSNVNAGATLANWLHVGISSTGAIGSNPDTPSYTVLATTAQTQNMYPSAIILANGDLAYIYKKTGSYYVRRATWNGNSWNALGTETKLCDIQVAGTDTGYSLKQQLITLPVEQSDNIYVAFPVWLSNVLGDTVRLCKIDSSNVATFYEVNSANGAHAYAPCTDIALIDTRIIISYLKTSKDTYVRVFSGLTPLTAETLMVSNANPVDIPLLAQRKVNNKLLSLYRIEGTPPQIGRKTFMDFA